MTLSSRFKATLHYWRSLKREPVSKALHRERKRAVNEELRRAVARDRTIDSICYMAVAEALRVE